MQIESARWQLTAWNEEQALAAAQAGLPGPAEAEAFCGLVAWIDGKPAGWALCPASRGRRAGLLWEPGRLEAQEQQTLLKALIRQESEKGRQLLTLDLPWREQGFLALEQVGFRPWFTTSHMIYRGALLPEPNLPFFPYDDSYYRPFQRLQSRAFFRLRQENDVEPYVLAPSIEDRLWLAQNRRDVFLLKVQGRLAAAGFAAKGALDMLAVDQAFQGRGYGKALVAYGVNRLLERSETPRLEALDWNKPALGLYRHMGFELEQRRQLLRRGL